MHNKQKATHKVHTGTDRHIDTTTGEVMDIIPRHRFKLNENLKFIFFMDEKSIFKDLSGAEIKVFLLLALSAEMDTGIVRTSQIDKQRIADDMGITSAQTVSNIISTLAVKGFLIKQERGIYKLNENHAWKGSLRKMTNKKNENELSEQ